MPVVGFPYYGGYYADAYDSNDDEDYQGGPTVFDRRGSGEVRSHQRVAESDPAPAVAAAPSAPVAAQPSTLLVFKDGHQSEVQNYAIVGATLFDLTENRSHKILLADLDLASTRKANEDRGVDFRVPGETAR